MGDARRGGFLDPRTRVVTTARRRYRNGAFCQPLSFRDLPGAGRPKPVRERDTKRPMRAWHKGDVGAMLGRARQAPASGPSWFLLTSSTQTSAASLTSAQWRSTAPDLGPSSWPTATGLVSRAYLDTGAFQGVVDGTRGQFENFSDLGD